MPAQRRVVAPDRHRPAEKVDCFTGITAQERQEPAPMQRIGMIGLDFEHLPEACVGIAAAALADVFVAIANANQVSPFSSASP
jgi:hypothetical protein